MKCAEFELKKATLEWLQELRHEIAVDRQQSTKCFEGGI